MPTNQSVAITTCANESEATKIAKLLVSRKLAACVQALPITSTFFWESEVQQEKEVLLLIKTSTDRVRQIEQLINENHSYELPEFISLSIEDGSPGYLNWILETLR